MQSKLSIIIGIAAVLFAAAAFCTSRNVNFI